MGYSDGLALLKATGSSSRSVAPRSTFGTTSLPSFGTSGAIGGFGGGAPVGSYGGSKAPAAPAYDPSKFTGKVDFTAPWTTPLSPPKLSPPTTGDLFGSLGATLGNAMFGTSGQPAYLTMENAIPWFMERTGVVASEAAKSLTSDDENIVSQALDGLGQVLGAIATPVAAALQFPVDVVKNAGIWRKTETYRALVTGDSSPLPVSVLSGLTTFLTIFNGPFGISDTLKGALVGFESPERRRQLAEAIDLPDATKRSIEADPTVSFDRILADLDKTTEGRQFTYSGGLPGAAWNAGGTLSIFLAEMLATGGLAGVAGGAAAASSVPAISLGAKAIAYGARGVNALQKAALATGISYLPLATTLETVARMQGDQAAVAWWDKMNRSTLISDEPAIQLVTSFSVDPIGALKYLKAGSLKLAHGPAIAYDKVTLGKITRVYTQRDAVRNVLARVMDTTPEGVDAMIGPTGWYENWGQATDRVFDLAIDHLGDEGVNIISKEDRILGMALGGGQKTTEFFMRKYAGQVADLIRTNPNIVGDRIRVAGWQYHNFVGPYNPAMMMALERDYVVAKKTADILRSRGADVVPGYVDLLGPRSQVLAREQVDRLFERGNVTLHDLNELNKDFPAIRDLYRDLVPGKARDEPVARAVFDTVLERASQVYANTAKTNPLRVRTGVDPILRPGSKSPTRDWAEAFGTSEDTIKAIESGPGAWDQAAHDLVAAFGRDKGIIGVFEGATLSKEALWEKVSGWVDEKSTRWVERGTAVEATETTIANLDQEIADLSKLVASGETWWKAELNRLQVDRAGQYALLSDVREPYTPFTQAVKFGRTERANDATLARATRIVDAQDRLKQIGEIDAQVDSWNPIGSTSPLAMIRKRTPGSPWTWAGKAPPMSDSIYAKLADFLSNYVGSKGQNLARSMAEMGDEDLWNLALQYRDAATFRKSLTSVQRKAVDRITDVGRRGSLDEYASAWRVKTGQAPNVGDDEFLAELIMRREARDAILDGSSEFHLTRTSEAKVPDWALKEAQAGRPSDLWQDPVVIQGREVARARLATALDGGSDTFAEVRKVVEDNPILKAEARQIAEQKGIELDALLSDAGNAGSIRTLVGAMADEPIIPGVPRALTELDQAAIAGDTDAIAAIVERANALVGRIAEPLRDVPQDVAEQLARTPRPSRVFANDLADAEVDLKQIVDMSLWDKHPVGAKIASMLYHGADQAHPPRTPEGLLTVLREIENGNAANFGFGNDVLVEAKVAIESVLRHTIGEARKAQIEVGVLGMGKDLNPYTATAERWAAYRDFVKTGTLVVRDDRLGIQYGFKQRPTDAIVLELDKVPGLAEELLTGYFQPWAERLGTAHIRQAYNIIFGPKANQAVFYEARGRFVTALEKKGIDPALATKIWSDWKAFTRAPEQRTARDYPWYASEKNLPAHKLNLIADQTIEKWGRSHPVDFDARTLNVAEEFRLSTSYVRRKLFESGLPMGKVLAKMYGAAAHNAVATTYYYHFRFLLDLRYHIQNDVEGPMLYAGRAGLRNDPGNLIVGDDALMGMTRERVTRGNEGLMDPSYPYLRSRDEYVYRTLKAEQPDALRGLMADNPEAFKDAMLGLAKADPELRATIRAMGDTPESWLQGLSRTFDKAFDSLDPEAAIMEDAMKEAIADPALAEVWGLVAKNQADLLANIRATFYGNPSRSLIERTLNHYLLFWPTSYLIKSTKWLLRIMYDRAGGLKTNSAGAYGMDQLAQYHTELMATDPEYAQTISEHQNLIWVAGMLFPATPFQIGVSLNPIMRNIFFGTNKDFTNIGPIYTITKLLPGVRGELYHDLGDLPGMDVAFGALGEDTRKKPDGTLRTP